MKRVYDSCKKVRTLETNPRHTSAIWDDKLKAGWQEVLKKQYHPPAQGANPTPKPKLTRSDVIEQAKRQAAIKKSFVSQKEQRFPAPQGRGMIAGIIFRPVRAAAGANATNPGATPPPWPPVTPVQPVAAPQPQPQPVPVAPQPQPAGAAPKPQQAPPAQNPAAAPNTATSQNPAAQGTPMGPADKKGIVQEWKGVGSKYARPGGMKEAMSDAWNSPAFRTAAYGAAAAALMNRNKPWAARMLGYGGAALALKNFKNSMANGRLNAATPQERAQQQAQPPVKP